jgi:hypothetical protein
MLSEAPWWFIRFTLVWFTISFVMNICSLLIRYHTHQACEFSPILNTGKSNWFHFVEADWVLWVLFSILSAELVFTFIVTILQWGIFTIKKPSF